MIAVSPEGNCFTKEHYKDEGYVLNLSFFETQLLTNITKDNHEENEDNEEEGEEDIVVREVHRIEYLYDVIDSGTFVAMRCPANSLEQFFVGEVLMKEMAVENINDSNGHFILKGEKYLEVQYLEKKYEGKQFIEYIRSKQSTSFIHLGEVFACQVELNLDLKMKHCEYLSLQMGAL